MKSIKEIEKLAQDENHVIAAMMFLRESNKNLFNVVNLVAAELAAQGSVTVSLNRIDQSLTLKVVPNDIGK
jgi:hypothetical protein